MLISVLIRGVEKMAVILWLLAFLFKWAGYSMCFCHALFLLTCLLPITCLCSHSALALLSPLCPAALPLLSSLMVLFLYISCCCTACLLLLLTSLISHSNFFQGGQWWEQEQGQNKTKQAVTWEQGQGQNSAYLPAPPACILYNFLVYFSAFIYYALFLYTFLYACLVACIFSCLHICMPCLCLCMPCCACMLCFLACAMVAHIVWPALPCPGWRTECYVEACNHLHSPQACSVERDSLWLCHPRAMQSMTSDAF